MTATEIRRDVEGYSGMNEDAFARRFYADRAELEALSIHLTVEKPLDGAAEQENYSLRPENFHLPRDRVLGQGAGRAADRPARSWTASSPTPSRCASPSSRSPGDGRARCARPTSAPSRSASPRPPAGTTSRSGSPRSRRRSSATRRSPSTTTRWSATRRTRARSTRTTCSSRAASSTSSATRTSATRSASSASRESAARSPTRRRPSTTSSAPPTSTRAATRSAPSGSSATRSAPPRSSSPSGSRGRSSATSAATARRRRRRRAPITFKTAYASARQLISWVLGLGEHARVVAPPELVEEFERRVALHRGAPHGRPQAGQGRARRRSRAAAATAPRAATASRDAAIRPERFARLVTLASILIEAGRRGPAPDVRGGAASACRSPTRSCARTSTC